MHFRFLAAAGVAGLMLFAPTGANAQTKHEMKAGCCDMPCCADHMMADAKTVAEPSAIEMLLAMAPQVTDPQWAPAPPVRQASDVWFMRPVMVNGKILQGHYVIQHDNDRMARGEPCTHIYAFNDRTKPVVTFDCKHLERDRASQTTASVATKGDMQVLTEFQFAGDTAAHGVPVR
jgi:hypothetical protein